MTPIQSLYWFIATLGNAGALYNLYLHDTRRLAWALAIFTVIYSVVGFYDLFFSRHSLNRLYPVMAYIRYFLESFRVEIQQYFIANNTEEKPFNREHRSLVYRRSKNESSTLAFGTQRDLMENNYLSIWHSMSPTHVKPSAHRVTIGGKHCKQPYSSSYLNISAMSFGALSQNAIEALNLGAKKGGFSHNTGEGGVSPYHLKHGGDLVWQIGTGLFGCRHEDGRFHEEMFAKTASRTEIKMIEIKMSQGAKPAHGGVLPLAKITDEIAAIRGVSKNQDCVSPPVNPECTTPESLLNFISKLRELSGGKPIGIKLCIGNPSEFLGLCKAMIKYKVYPDFITVDGAEGGTGAAPVEYSNRLGMMCLEGVYFVHNALIGIGLRDEIKIIASGKTASSFELVSKVALGADVVNAARTMMFAIGCVQSRHCNTNNCPTGIATQDPTRSKAIDVKLKSERVHNFHRNTLDSFFELVGSMGVDDPTLLTPIMIKRRTHDGLYRTSGSTVDSLKINELINEQSKGIWAKWWQAASSDKFYVPDTVVLIPSTFNDE